MYYIVCLPTRTYIHVHKYLFVCFWFPLFMELSYRVGWVCLVSLQTTLSKLSYRRHLIRCAHSSGNFWLHKTKNRARVTSEDRGKKEISLARYMYVRVLVYVDHGNSGGSMETVADYLVSRRLRSLWPPNYYWYLWCAKMFGNNMPAKESSITLAYARCTS